MDIEKPIAKQPGGELKCICETLPLNHTNYTTQVIGVDQREGRFGEVEIKKCRHCQRSWLRYFVEYEHITRSGRWYLGLINDKIIPQLTPENSTEYLEEMEWYFMGGSYFSSTGKVSSGKLILD